MVLFVRAVPANDTSMLWTMFNFQIQCYDVVVHTKHHCAHYRMLTECQVARSGKNTRLMLDIVPALSAKAYWQLLLEPMDCFISVELLCWKLPESINL